MEQWYYVLNNERIGPISKDELMKLIDEKKLGPNNYVWTKSFKDWMKISEVNELKNLNSKPRLPKMDFDWNTLNKEEKNLYLLIGKDRGQESDTQYGPYNFATVLKLYQDNRINRNTYIWTKGLNDWIMMSEAKIFDKVVGEENDAFPNVIAKSKENRQNPRKPFIARILFRNNKKILEGVCRDISIGGMQVLVDSAQIKVSDVIDINVHPENSEYHFVAKGEVARILPGDQGFSFRFKELSNEAETAIESYLRKNS